MSSKVGVYERKVTVRCRSCGREASMPAAVYRSVSSFLAAVNSYGLLVALDGSARCCKEPDYTYEEDTYEEVSDHA